LHRDPKLYPDPLRFDPDRWLPEQRSAASAASFIPFNLGIRKCIGDHFAMTEMIIATAVIASRWRLRVPLKHTPREHISATVNPGNLLMIVRSR
jgi:cyclooctat-9-en-7-ol 5-monooxygenase